MFSRLKVLFLIEALGNSVETSFFRLISPSGLVPEKNEDKVMLMITMQITIYGKLQYAQICFS